MKLILVVGISLLSATVWARPPVASKPVLKKDVESEYYLSPGKDTPASAEIGETLYDEGTRQTIRTYQGKLSSAVDASLANGYKLEVPEGSAGPILARTGSEANMMCFIAKNSGMMNFFAGGKVTACLVDADNDLSFDHTEFDGYAEKFPLSSPVPYKVTAQESPGFEQESLVVQVLYQGLSKGEIKLSFREFKNGLARPAFTQDVSYELQPDGKADVGFKGMRLRVTKATNTRIEYVLEQPVTSMAEIRAKAAAEAGARKSAWWRRQQN